MSNQNNTLSSVTQSGQTHDFAAMQGGLSDPVMQSQKVFRAIMDAMAQPGTIQSLEAYTQPPQPLGATAGAVLATLADADTPIWLDATLSANQAVRDWLTFHVGASFAAEPSQAAFAMIANAARMPSLEVFAQGDQAYPDRSTTLILQVESLANQPSWTLTGPGIKDTAHLAVDPISPLFAGQWADNNKLFPRGVDAILAAPDGLAALPRTTRLALNTPAANSMTEKES